MWNRGNAPHREVPHHPESGLLSTQTGRTPRGCIGTYKPDGAHRCEAPLLKVGHHGLDNKKSVILEISLEGFFNSLTLLLNSLPVPQESYDPFFTYLKTVLNVYSPLPDRRKCRVLFYYFTGGKTTMETSSLGSNLGP